MSTLQLLSTVLTAIEFEKGSKDNKTRKKNEIKVNEGNDCGNDKINYVGLQRNACSSK